MLRHLLGPSHVEKQCCFGALVHRYRKKVFWTISCWMFLSSRLLREISWGVIRISWGHMADLLDIFPDSWSIPSVPMIWYVTSHDRIRDSPWWHPQNQPHKHPWPPSILTHWLTCFVTTYSSSVQTKQSDLNISYDGPNVNYPWFLLQVLLQLIIYRHHKNKPILTAITSDAMNI